MLGWLGLLLRRAAFPAHERRVTRRRPKHPAAVRREMGLGRSLLLDLSILQPNDQLASVNASGAHLDEVGDEDDGAALKQAVEAVLDDVGGCVAVNGAEDVVEEDDVAIGVDGASQGDALLLTSVGRVKCQRKQQRDRKSIDEPRHRQALLADSSLVAIGEAVEVALQGAGMQSLVVALLIVILAEENIGLDGVVCGDPERRSARRSSRSSPRPES